jgi:AraC-like DNA-binding protein
MTVSSESAERFARLLNEVAVAEGVHNTFVDGVRVARHSTVLPRTPVVYEPAIVIVGQGRKRSYIGEQIYDYDSSSYFVLSVPLPAECEWEATPEKPVLVLGIKVDPAILGEVVLEMDEPLPPSREAPRGVTMRPLSRELSSAAIRLLECLRCPLDSRVLGRTIVREIVYRALREDQDGALRALANRDGNFIRIAKVLREVHADSAKPFTVESMSKRAGMSIAAFHHNFKLVAGSSPLQYLKRIRLDRAKRLMVHDGYNASTAAKAVGYESASQFSREFKRQFGMTPREDADRLRQPVEQKPRRRRGAFS